MIVARVAHIVSTWVLVLLVLGSPLFLMQLVFVFAYRAFIEGIIIGSFPLTMFFLQRTAERCLDTRTYSDAFRIMGGLLAVHVGLVWYAYESLGTIAP
jgi:hypothetical protein